MGKLDNRMAENETSLLSYIAKKLIQKHLKTLRPEPIKLLRKHSMLFDIHLSNILLSVSSGKERKQNKQPGHKPAPSFCRAKKPLIK